MSLQLKLGAEPKKVAILAGLLVVAAAAYFWGPSSSAAPETSKRAAPAAPQPARKVLQEAQQAADVETAAAKPGPAAAGKAGQHDYKPSMKRKAGQTTDPERFDPTLRTDLLVKLANVRMEGVSRSLFDLSGVVPAAVPQKKLPEPKIVVKKVRPMIGPPLPPPPPPPPAPVVKPPPPPIPLKFYGRALPVRGGVKRVFCILGDEVAIPTEGEVLQKRYKIKRIAPTSVLVEDLSFSHEQTLPIEEPLQTPGGF
jgi:hypothetical protein